MHRKNRRPLNAMEISERVRHKMALLHFYQCLSYFLSAILLFICYIDMLFQLQTFCEDNGNCEGVDLNRY